MDHAIRYAMLEIKLKEQKYHKSKDRWCRPSYKYESFEETECCKELEAELAEGQESPIFLSPIVDRKTQRREAISEKNPTERALVKWTLKHYMQAEHASRYTLN